MIAILLTIAGIAAPAFLLTFAVRRWVSRVPWAIGALFLAMTLAFLHGAVFSTRVPVPVDEVARGYPYRGIVGEVISKNPLTNDTAKLFLPWMQVAREELFAFRAPLWNRYSFSGYPLLANGESAPFSPFFLSTLFVPLPKQIVAMAGLKIFCALLFTWMLARRHGVSQAGSLFAATAFAWSVFQTVFLYYSTTAVTALLPAALYALLETQREASRRTITLTAIVVATLMANGHPESVLHIAVGAAGVLLIDLALAADRSSWIRRLRLTIFGVAAGLALSAFTWVPVAQQVMLSTRLGDLRRAPAHAPPYPLTALWAMVSANGFGNPVRHNWNWILNYSSIAASYVGLVVLILFAAAALSTETPLRDRLWAVYAVLLWLVAMQWTFVGRLANAVPPFSISANDKLRFVALLIASIVAAGAADRIRQRLSIPLFVASAAVIVLAARVFFARRSFLTMADGVVILIAFVAIMGTSIWRSRAAHIVFVATALELFVINAGFNALVDAKYYCPRLPIIDAARRAAPDEPFRMVGFDWTFLPNASAQYGLEAVRGSDPMSFDAYTEYLKRIAVDDPSIDVDRVTRVDDPELDFLNVRFLLTDPGASFGDKWNAVYNGVDGTLLENRRARRRFFVASGDGDVGAIRNAEPTRFSVSIDAKTPVTLGSSQPFAPGWIARVDGRRTLISRFESAFVSVELPTGKHQVEVVYRPLAFYASLPVSALTAILLFVWSRKNPPSLDGKQMSIA